jgi:hypothetical protein
MISSLFTASKVIISSVLVIFLLAGLVLAAFAVFKAAQPMELTDANEMTYWSFIRERVQAIKNLPSKCHSLYLVTFLTVPPYSLMYTYVGVYPDSFLARHTNPNDPWLPQANIQLNDAPGAWWSQLEKMSWHALTAERNPMTECNLPLPK